MIHVITNTGRVCAANEDSTEGYSPGMEMTWI